jgi:hypothetical protein
MSWIPVCFTEHYTWISSFELQVCTAEQAFTRSETHLFRHLPLQWTYKDLATGRDSNQESYIPGGRDDHYARASF